MSVLIRKSGRPDNVWYNVWYTQGVAEQYYLEMCNKYHLLGQHPTPSDNSTGCNHLLALIRSLKSEVLGLKCYLI